MMPKLQHLGIIADGNRRWAKERGLKTIEGHKKGLEVIEELIEEAARLKIPYITFYVFSTENWGRTAGEVSYIMQLAETRIMNYAEKMAQAGVQMLILGAREKVSPKLLSLIEEAEKMTAFSRESAGEGSASKIAANEDEAGASKITANRGNFSGTTVCFCFNYGGKQEIADAAKIAQKVEGEITPETIEKHLYHPEVPAVDMIVRTSGEERTSGFMLWRGAYAELMFLKKYFPEMEKADLGKILAEFEKRQRRFGK